MKTNILLLTLLTTICFCACNPNDPEFRESEDIPSVCHKLTHMKLYDMIQHLNKEGYVVVKQNIDDKWETKDMVKKEDISPDGRYKYSISNIDNSTEWIIEYRPHSGENFTDEDDMKITAYKYLSDSQRDFAIQISKSWSKYMLKHYRRSSKSIGYTFYYSDDGKAYHKEGFSWRSDKSPLSELTDNENKFWEMVKNNINIKNCTLDFGYNGDIMGVRYIVRYLDGPKYQFWYHYENYLEPSITN